MLTGPLNGFGDRARKLFTAMLRAHVIARPARAGAQHTTSFITDKSGGAGLPAIDSEVIRHVVG